MTESSIKTWVKRMVKLLRRPAPAILQERPQLPMDKAFALIDESFSAKRAQTCKSVLRGLLRLAKDGIIEGMSQKKIAEQIGWSASTISYYTNRMEELHILSVSRTTKRNNGKFMPNTYMIAPTVWKSEETKIQPLLTNWGDPTVVFKGVD